MEKHYLSLAVNRTQPPSGRSMLPLWVSLCSWQHEEGEGDCGSDTGGPMVPSGCELLGYLRNLKRTRIVCKGLGPELRKGKREETLLSEHMGTQWHMLHIFNRTNANRKSKTWTIHSQDLGNTYDAPGTTVNCFRNDLT